MVDSDSIKEEEDEASIFNPAESGIVQRLVAQKDDWRRYGPTFRLFCGGAVMIGPVRSWWWCLLGFTLLVYLLSIYDICSGHPKHFYILIIGGALLIGVLVCNGKVCLRDPGIWPRPSFETAYANAVELVTERHRGDPYFTPVKMIEMHNGKTLSFSYCHRCNNFRPPKTGHCSTCDVCIEDWDHHCPVFGGCVGKNNFKYFFAMVFTTGIIHLFFGIAHVMLQIENEKATDFLGYLKGSAVLCAYCIGIPMTCILPAVLSSTPCEKNRNYLYEPETGSEDEKVLSFRKIAANNTTLDPYLKHIFPYPKTKNHAEKPDEVKVESSHMDKIAKISNAEEKESS